MISGNLYPSAMRVLDDGRLLVAFTTKAGFNGKFILQDAAPQGSHLKCRIHCVQSFIKHDKVDVKIMFHTTCQG